MESVVSCIPAFLKAHDYIGLSDAASSSSSSSSSATIQSDADAECTMNDTELGLDLGLGLGLGSGLAKQKENGMKKTGESKVPENKSLPDILRSAGMKRSHSEVSMAEPRYNNQESNNSSFLSSTWSPAKPSIPSWMEKKTGSNVVEEVKSNISSEVVAQEPEVDDGPPPPKDRIVGWPPVRMFRKQTLAKSAETFVKVNMDGITVGRKVDLNAYTSYEGLKLALEEMFQPSYAAQGPVRGDLKHFLSNGSEFVMTYEDKDGDWMLVGDVPWSMFVSSVRRLRIARGSEVNK